MTQNFYKKPEFETLQLHAGYSPDPTTNARAVPIYPSTSFVFDSTQHAADLFTGKVTGNTYSRVTNPTVSVLEQRVTALEGGVASLAVSSGQAAQFIAIAALAAAGDNIISTTYLFGGTISQFKALFLQFGIEVRFVASDKAEDYASKIDERTRALFVEAMGNPKYNVAPIPELAKLAHDNGIPLIVDNTFGAGGWLIRPFEHGADIIVHSATKWLGGHGTTIGGIVVDGGTFDWKQNDKFRLITSPVDLVEKFGEKAYIARCRSGLLRDLGTSLSPFAAWAILQGIETLSLRLERSCENTLALAKWLRQHERVAWVQYPGLEDHESHRAAQRLLKPGYYGAMLNFAVKAPGSDLKEGNEQAGLDLINRVKLASHLVNVGDCKTLIVHPASTTHFIVSPEDRVLSGVTQDLIRVSVGIEHISDIIADFEQALKLPEEK